ncbi:MAG: peroxiredoxin [Methylococcales bacterium]
MSTLKIGDKAPEFSLFDDKNNMHNLSDYQGKWLVLFFYPKDNTPGCTIEACQFRDNYVAISTENTKILGISTDKIDSHSQFIRKYQLPFPLLSDNTGSISKFYGSLFKLGPIKFCKRHSFIIDPEGNIAKIYRKVTPAQHSKQIIVDIKDLQASYNNKDK